VAFAGPGVNVVSTVPEAKGFEGSDIETESGMLIDAPAMGGSPLGEVTAEAVVCGFGAPEEFPSNTTGKIALIRRSPQGSTFYFRDKVRNALNAGAIGVVMMQSDERTDLRWTVIVVSADNETKWPIMLNVLKEEGDQLAAKAGKEKLTLSYRIEEYVPFSGTSMATPHVSGAAALAWSLAPNATAEQVRLALKLTASDLGPPGYDDFFGYGRVDAIAAAKYLAPATFNVPPPPPLDPKRKRQGH
jgi:subtilisin family serine protease